MNRSAALIVFITFTGAFAVSMRYERALAAVSQDSINVQCLDGQGIHFKVPSSWRACLHGVNYDSEDHATVTFIWRSKTNEGINVTVVTFKRGFTLVQGEPATAAQKMKQEYGLLAAAGRSSSHLPPYADLKRHNLGDVAGFSFTSRFAALEELGQPSEEINWTGYRVYNGKAQEISLRIDSSAKQHDVVRALFDTANVEQDRPLNEP